MLSIILFHFGSIFHLFDPFHKMSIHFPINSIHSPSRPSNFLSLSSISVSLYQFLHHSFNCPITLIHLPTTSIHFPNHVHPFPHHVHPFPHHFHPFSITLVHFPIFHPCPHHIDLFSHDSNPFSITSIPFPPSSDLYSHQADLFPMFQFRSILDAKPPAMISLATRSVCPESSISLKIPVYRAMIWSWCASMYTEARSREPNQPNHPSLLPSPLPSLHIYLHFYLPSPLLL
jgi:hypothetical protein